MSKERSQIDSLWGNTIPIDTWILENISFNKNNWHQKVPIGSKFKAFHNSTRNCDIIHYFRGPGCKDKPIFGILYYETACVCTAETPEINNGYRPALENAEITMEYTDPGFFDRLESWIWNVRTIDYIIADLHAVAHNIKEIEHKILRSKESTAKQFSFIKRLYEKTGELDLTVRELAFTNGDPDNVAFPTVDGIVIKDTLNGKSMPMRMHGTYEKPRPESHYDDDVPF